LRILLAIPLYLNPNEGAAGVTLRLAEAYRRLGHQVTVCGLGDFRMGRSLTWAMLEFPLRLARRYRGAAARSELDVVDAAGFCSWALGLRWPADARTLLVMRSHGLEHCYYRAHRDEARAAGRPLGWKYRTFMRTTILPMTTLAMRRAGLVLLLNREELEFAANRLGIARERMRLVPNGIDAAMLGLPFAPTPMAPHDALRIAWIGAWQPRKGPRYAVRALSSLLERFAFVEASLLGTGVDPERVLAEFPVALRPRLKVIPHYENGELPALLAGHQIELMTSVVEAFGVAQVEAMACGLAPVAPTIGGPLEVIADGKDGLLVAPRDPQAAADAVARLIEDRALLDSLRRRAHAKAQRFGWDAVARANLARYEEFLARRGRQGTCSSDADAYAPARSSLNRVR
jgi:glycosyltransferase involved in cell wall biosynthesis